jgi:hypothetical protein
MTIAMTLSLIFFIAQYFVLHKQKFWTQKYMHGVLQHCIADVLQKKIRYEVLEQNQG